MTVTDCAPLPLPKRAASEAQFLEFCRKNRDYRIEQTKEGKWVIMAPTGFSTGSRNNEICRQLGNWARQNGAGIAVDSSTGFTLPNGAKRSPDAAWVTRARLAGLTAEQKQRFLPLCPDFVIELRSPSDSLADTQEKMAEYRDNGARLGWLIDAAERQVHIYRPEAEVIVENRPETIAADPELPGFILELAWIWDPGF